MTCSQPLAEALRSRGFRMTPQRHAILHVLKSSGGHLTPAQVFEQAHASAPGITETTVYRTLEFLAANGVALVADRGNGHLAYELAGETHHRLVCRSCGAQVEVEAGAVQGLLDQLEQQTGYRLDAGHLTIFGLCSLCKETPNG